MSSVREFVAQHRDRYLGWYSEACTIPSLALQPDGLAKMARWVEEKLQALGAEVERLTLDGAPDVLLGHLGSGKRTVLVYDHYDVQPPDPLELWKSDPFKPEIRDGFFYARGAADNKGDLVARLAGLEVYREVVGELPVNIKMLVEGEEETGSRNFEALVSRYGHKLTADGCVWEGAGVDHAGRPEFVFGAKGLAYVELNHRGLNDDQHSSVAVIAPSPVWHLIAALSSLRDEDGRVLIDGFYDDAKEPTKEDWEMLETLPYDEEGELKRLGVDRFIGGSTGTELLRRYFFEPTCNIAGLEAGFTERGTSKTVLPKEAMAKLDLRLVPDQNPHDIVTKLRRHLDANGFADIDITSFSMQSPVRSPVDSLVGRATLRGAKEVFGKDPAPAPLMIATGPMYPIAGTLGIPTVSPGGVCRPDSNIHAPNENVAIDDFFRTIEYTTAWIDAFATEA